VIIYAGESLIRDMEDKVFEQAVNVARLPGIVQATYVMPDAHWVTASRLVAWRRSIRTAAV